MTTVPRTSPLMQPASRARIRRFVVSCLAAASVFVALAALPGCAGPTEPQASSPVSSPSASTGATPTPGVGSDDSLTPTPGRLGLDEASRSAALELAETAMGLFARPDVAYEAWWADLQPLLSAPGAAAYATVDPAGIPARHVTGAASLPGWTTPEVARVSVPTDVGSYLVVLSRSDTDPVWRVERFIPPEVLS